MILKDKKININFLYIYDSGVVYIYIIYRFNFILKMVKNVGFYK